MHLLATIIMVFCLIPTASAHLDSPPPPERWFIEHIELKPFELPSGVSTTIVLDEYGVEYLVIKNDSVINLYIAGTPFDGRSNFENIGIEFTPGTGPLYKVVDGNAYHWRNGWSQNGLYKKEIDSLWLNISDNSIRCNGDRVFDLEPRNRFSYDRPKDVKIPEPQEALLPIVYGTEFIYIPLTISYILNPEYNPPRAFNVYEPLVILLIIGLIVFIAIFYIIFKVILKKINDPNLEKNA